MITQRKLYIGIGVKKFFRYEDKSSGVINLDNVSSFKDIGYYCTWQEAYKDIEARMSIYNDKQHNLPDRLKRKYGFYQFSLLDVFCIPNDTIESKEL